jgi:hypothetical protein
MAPSYKYKATIDDYNGDDAEDEYAHQTLQAPPDFRGPTEERYCTDIFCLFLLVLSWIVMTGLGAYASQNGDYRYIVYPLDYQVRVVISGDFRRIDCDSRSLFVVFCVLYVFYIPSFSERFTVDVCMYMCVAVCVCVLSGRIPPFNRETFAESISKRELI